MSEKNCDTCKKTPLISIEKKALVVGFYLLVSSVYGTIEIVKKIISFF